MNAADDFPSMEERLGFDDLTRGRPVSDEAVEEMRRHAEARAAELDSIEGEVASLDMAFVQLLITATNESKLPPEFKAAMRTKLDRMQFALMHTNELKVVM